MSSLSQVWHTIEGTIQTEISDVHAIFGPKDGSGFTQANFVKLGMDIENGFVVTEQQVTIGLRALAIWAQGAIPIAEKTIAEAQLIAVAAPAVQPVLDDMQLGLQAAQTLDALLLAGTNTTPQTIPEGIKTLSTLAEQVGGWAKNAITLAKSAPNPIPMLAK